MRGRDPERRRVVVRAEMRGGDPAVSARDELRQRDAAVAAENRLRRLHHQLEPQRAWRQPEPRLELLACGGERRHLLGRRDFRQRHHEIRRQHAARAVEQRREKQLEGAKAPALRLAQILDADADAGRQRASLQSCDGVRSGRPRGRVFLRIRAVAEAVLEVNAIVLDGLALELVHDPRIDSFREIAAQSEGGRERRGV